MSPELIAAAIVGTISTIIGLLSVIDSVHVKRDKARKKAALLVAKSNEDEGIYTHAEVLASLPSEVRWALRAQADTPLSGVADPVKVWPARTSLPEAEVWVGNRLHELRVKLLPGPVGDPAWDVFAGTCSVPGCGWNETSSEAWLLQKFGDHKTLQLALEGRLMVPDDAVITPFMLQTNQPQHVWYEYNADGQRLTFTRPAQVHQLIQRLNTEYEERARG